MNDPRGERGQALVLLAVVAMVLLLFIGLAINAGQLFVAKASQRQAADAAAFAGAVTLFQGGTTAQAVAAATVVAALNGYTSGGATQVTVNVPPASGAYAGDPTYAEVIITVDVDPLLRPAGGGVISVSARGVAGARVPVRSTDALVALNATASQALAQSGTGRVTVIGGDIFVASNSPTAATVEGGGSISAAGRAIRVVGGYSGTNWTPTPSGGAASRPDPLAGYALPSTSGLGAPRSCCDATQISIAPGIYSSMNVSHAVLMQPGTYILEGGGLILSAGGSLAGAGVTIFNTTTTYPSPGGTCSAVDLSKGTPVLSAPSSGTYRGMLIYQDPACTATLSVAGNVGLSLVGSVYLPKGTVSVGGTADLAVNAKLVADQIKVSGTGTYTVTFDQALNARAFVPGLSE